MILWVRAPLSNSDLGYMELAGQRFAAVNVIGDTTPRLFAKPILFPYVLHVRIEPRDCKKHLVALSANYTNVLSVGINVSLLTNEDLSQLKRFKTLVGLHLTGIDSRRHRLATCLPGRILQITLSDTDVLAGPAAETVSVPFLKELTIQGCTITTAGLDSFRCPSLEELSLDRCSVGNGVLEKLAGLNNLHVLKLAKSKFNPGELTALTKAIPGLKVSVDQSSH